MSKRPISLGGPDGLTKSVKKSPAPESAPAPEHTTLDKKTVSAIRTVIYRIAEHKPLNLAAVMRAIGKGVHNFGTYFGPESKRVMSESLNALVALFECETPEEFFALDPNTRPGLGELIQRKGLEQYRKKLRKDGAL